MKRYVLAALAVLVLLSGTAMGGLVDTTMDLQLTQSGVIGDLAGPTGGMHVYGTTDTFWLEATVSWDVTSPAPHPDFDHSLRLDFTNFQYMSYTVLGPSTSTLVVSGLAEAVELGSVHVYLPFDLGTPIEMIASSSGDGFAASWDVGTVAMSNPVNPEVVVAWNSIPAPGSLALLGLAGLCARRRRRG